MTQRTFNQINTSPTLFEHREEDTMESEPVQKSKRGRKRQSDEEGLSDVEKLKKEKNRKAAQKCREKKEREAKNLKQRNEELERENKKLTEEKNKLEERAQEFHRIIENHIKIGCKLPSDVREVYNEGAKGVFANGNSEEVEIFRAVGTIERDCTPPHTPDGSSSGKLSPHLQNNFCNLTGSQTGAPTALFSGKSLTEQELTRKRSASTSRSPSTSPALPLSPAKMGPQVTGRQKDISHLLISDKLPKPLAPISVTRNELEIDFPAQLSLSSKQSVPTVVSEYDEGSKHTTGYMSKSFEIIDRGRNNTFNIHSSKFIEAALQLSDIPCEDEVAKQMSRESHNSQGEENSQNLPSLGFSCASNYSYTDDLQQMESVQEIIEYTSGVHKDDSQSLSTEKQLSCAPSPGDSKSQPVINVNACASALLGICEEMSESLQQQIKTSYSNPSSSVPETTSVSELTQSRASGNQQCLVMCTKQAPTQHVHINQNSGVDEQQMYVLKGQQLLRVDKQTFNYWKASKEGQTISNQSSEKMITLVSPEQLKALLASDLKSQFRLVHSQQSGQSQNSAQPVVNQEPHQFLKQDSDQILLHGPQSRRENQVQQIQNRSITRQSSKELQGQQDNHVQQMTTGSTSSKFVSVQGQSSTDNSTIARVQALIYASQLGSQATALSPSSASGSFHFSGSQPTPQHHYVIKQSTGNQYLFTSSQVPEASVLSEPTSSTTQTFNVSSDSSSYTSENTDYSVHVQDLPSLNFIEMHSEKNLFDKKPSRLAS